MMSRKPVLLCILDGWGISDRPEYDATAQANTPNFDRLMQGPNATLTTFGTKVGLPEGQMGNSEVGHMNIGAGRVIEMDLRRIERSIEQGSLAKQPAIRNLCSGSAPVVHLLGVLSDGGVHAHIDHLIEVTRILAKAGKKILLHLMTDGRDVAPKSALKYLDQLTVALPWQAEIATICGRYYPMDRDNRWVRIERAYGAMMLGLGAQFDTARQAIQHAYENGITDEFIEPAVIGGFTGMNDGDAVMLMNFRADRVRQLTAALGAPYFNSFDAKPRAKLSLLVGMSEYSSKHNAYMETVFPDTPIKNGLGEWVAKQGKTQFRIAETEKYPHVTFFFNGGIESPNEAEERYLAPSPKVATYDLQPEMSAEEVTEHLVTAIQSEEYDLLIVNYANPDMVGHTGNLDAATKACEAVDVGLGKVTDAIAKVDGTMLVIADHGNCEVMVDPETGNPHTAHTTNPVPVILFGADYNLGPDGILADIAPTLLELMGVEKPEEMTGQSLLLS